MLPSLRQLAVICLVWAVVAWYTVAVWAMKATAFEGVSAFSYFYAIRAPFVGAVVGLCAAPIFALGYHPRRLRSGHAEGRDPFAEDSRLDHALRFVDGAVNGQFVGGAISFLLLFLWPLDMQNTRMDALRWAGLFWKSYWYMFVPAAGFAGVISVWMALRHREAPSFRSNAAMHRLRARLDDQEPRSP